MCVSNGVIALFDNIQTKKEQGIPEEDREVCTQMHKDYQKLYDKVEEDYEFIQLLNEYDDLSGELRYSIKLRKSTMLKEAIESLVNVNKALVYAIVKYFNHTYTLNIEALEIIEQLPYCKRNTFNDGDFGFTEVEPILEIISKLHPDLDTAGREYIKTSFHKMFNYSYMPELKKKKVSLPWFFSYDEDPIRPIPNTMEIRSYSGDRIRFLEKAIYLFEYNKLPDDGFKYYIEPEHHPNDLKINNTKVYGNNIEYKFYKNRKVDIRFENEAQAEAFYNFYGLGNYEKD